MSEAKKVVLFCACAMAALVVVSTIASLAMPQYDPSFVYGFSIWFFDTSNDNNFRIISEYDPISGSRFSNMRVILLHGLIIAAASSFILRMNLKIVLQIVFGSDGESASFKSLIITSIIFGYAAYWLFVDDNILRAGSYSFAFGPISSGIWLLLYPVFSSLLVPVGLCLRGILVVHLGKLRGWS